MIKPLIISIIILFSINPTTFAQSRKSSINTVKGDAVMGNKVDNSKTTTNKTTQTTNINKSTKYQAKNIALGDNYGHIGDNIYGKTPRIVTDQILKDIISRANGLKYISIERRSGDSESLEFATKIVIALKKEGFDAFVNGITNDRHISDDPERDLKQQQEIGYYIEGNQLGVVIPSTQ